MYKLPPFINFILVCCLTLSWLEFIFNMHYFKHFPALFINGSFGLLILCRNYLFLRVGWIFETIAWGWHKQSCLLPYCRSNKLKRQDDRRKMGSFVHPWISLSITQNLRTIGTNIKPLCAFRTLQNQRIYLPSR